MLLFLLQSSEGHLSPLFEAFSKTQQAQDMRLSTQIDALRAQLQTANQTIVDLKRDLETLTNSLDVAREMRDSAAADFEKKLKALKDEGEALKGENKKLSAENKANLDAKTKANQEREKLKKELTEMQEKLAQLLQQKPKGLSKEMGDLQQKLKDANALTERLEAKLKKAEETRKKCEEKEGTHKAVTSQLAFELAQAKSFSVISAAQLLKEKGLDMAAFIARPLSEKAAHLKNCRDVLHSEFAQALQELKFDEAEQIAFQLKEIFQIDAVSKFVLAKAYHLRYTNPNPDWCSIDKLLNKSTEVEDVIDSLTIANFTLESFVAQDNFEEARSSLKKFQEAMNPENPKLVETYAKFYIKCCYIHNKSLTEEDQEWVAFLQEPIDTDPTSIEILKLALKRDRLTRIFEGFASPQWIKPKLDEINVQLKKLLLSR